MCKIMKFKSIFILLAAFSLFSCTNDKDDDTAKFPKIEHDGDAMYFVNAAKWGAMALYAWGDEEICGGWPGLQPTGQFEYKGYQWYYFDLGAANAGKEEHLIVNKNNNGEQVDAASYFLTTDSLFFFIVNGKTVTQAFSPEEVVEILSQD